MVATGLPDHAKGEFRMTKHMIAAATMITVAIGAGACGGSQADTVSKNLSTEAEKFNVQRKIVGINGITDKILFEVEGRCSIENDGRQLVVTCKHGPNDYRKHTVGLSDNVTFLSVQPRGVDVDEYRTKIVLKPQGLVPDLDLVTG